MKTMTKIKVGAVSIGLVGVGCIGCGLGTGACSVFSTKLLLLISETKPMATIVVRCSWNLKMARNTRAAPA